MRRGEAIVWKHFAASHRRQASEPQACGATHLGGTFDEQPAFPLAKERVVVLNSFYVLQKFYGLDLKIRLL